MFHARADQTVDVDVGQELPPPLGNQRSASINMTVKSLVFGEGQDAVRIDLDRRSGAWQLLREGDSIALCYQSDLWPGRSIGAAARVTDRVADTTPAPLDLADWLDRGFSLTASMAKRGLYFEDEPVALKLEGLHLAEEPEPVDVAYRVVDYYGNEAHQGRARLFEDGQRVVSLERTLPVDRLGIYRVEVTGPEALQKEVTFGRTPRPRRIGPDGTSVFATHANLANPYFPELAEQMGVRWTRMWGGNISTAALWRSVEPEPGQLRFDDAQIARARDRDLNILGLLGTQPAWLTRGPREWTDEDLAAWRRYCFETVSHYKEHIHHWEIWNEPYFTFDGPSYVRVLKAAYEACKEADPTCIVVGTCGPPWTVDWFDEVFAAGGYEFQDIVSAHLYPPGGGNGPLDYDESFREFARSIREVMRKHGGEKELWDTEAGMTPASPYNRLKQGRYFRSYGVPVPTDVLTDMAARLYAVHLVEGIRFYYYLLHGSFEYDSSLCENDGAPLPAAVAIAISASLLDGAEFVGEVKKGPVRAYAFRRGDEGVVTVWGVGLHGRRPTFTARVAPTSVLDVMGNEIKADRTDEALALPVSPSPLYLTFPAADLDGAVAALADAPEPELAPVAVQVRGVHEETVGPALALQVRNFQPEPTHFTVAFPSLPEGWALKSQPPYGEDREYVVHGERTLLFPVDVGAERSGEVRVALNSGEMLVPTSATVVVPAKPTPRPTSPHQPDAPLTHRDVQFVSAGPWTAKLDSGGLGTLYRGADPLLTSIYFYVARRGVNVATLNFSGSERMVEDIEGGKRVTVTRDRGEGGRCQLTATLLEGECALRWQLTVPPTKKGWGELGFYIPEAELNGGYPCETTVTAGGATRALTLSSESYPVQQSTRVSAIDFGGTEPFGIEIADPGFTGSHGWYFQDFRDSGRTRDRYRVVLSYSAEAGFEADFIVTVCEGDG